LNKKTASYSLFHYFFVILRQFERISKE